MTSGKAAPITHLYGHIRQYIRSGHSPPAPWSKLLDKKDYARALDCLLSLGWDDYAGQVVEFLNEDSREEFGDRPAWERLHNQVLNALTANA